MTIKEAMVFGKNELDKCNIELPILKVRILLSALMAKNKQYLLIHEDEKLEDNIQKNFIESIRKLCENIPIEYITNKKEFMKLDFYVDKNVLIPRQDTEILVEEVINICKKNNFTDVLDMCTGSGAIAISIAKYIENMQVIATDISIKALDVAKKNAINNNVVDRIKFIKSDMFRKIEDRKVDLIVSNPPYIEEKVIETLTEEVKKEPFIALNGGQDGLDLYKILINKSHKYLKENGYLCMEIGYNQKESIKNLFAKDNNYKDIYFLKDLAQNDRVVVAKRK